VGDCFQILKEESPDSLRRHKERNLFHLFRWGPVEQKVCPG